MKVLKVGLKTHQVTDALGHKGPREHEGEILVDVEWDDFVLNTNVMVLKIPLYVVSATHEENAEGVTLGVKSFREPTLEPGE